MEWIKHILKPLMGTVAFLACLIALPEPVHADRHPIGLSTLELWNMDAEDLRKLFYFLVIDDVSGLEKALQTQFKKSYLKPATPFGIYKVFTEVAGEAFSQTISYNEVNYSYPVEQVFNSRSSIDVRAAIRILRTLSKKHDPKAKEILHEILRQEDSIIFRNALILPGLRDVLSDWKALDFELTKLSLIEWDEEGNAIASSQLKDTRKNLENAKIEFQKTITDLRRLIMKALNQKTGFIFNRQPKFEAEKFKDDVTSFIADPSNQTPHEIVDASRLLYLAYVQYKRSLEVFPDMLSIKGASIKDGLAVLYDLVLSERNVNEHPFFDVSKKLNVETVSRVLSKDLALQNPKRIEDICRENLVRLGNAPLKP